MSEAQPGSPVRTALRRLWRVIYYGTILGFVAIILGVGFLLFTGKVFGPAEDEFVDLPGAQARPRLGPRWLDAVDPADVRRVSFKKTSTIDSHSTWYRIRLSPTAASVWEDEIHSQADSDYRVMPDRMTLGSEGVRRTVAGPPPLHHQTGTTPKWWTPPAIDFRATEAMEWYTGFDSGVGRATYSAYDQANGELWIYEYSCQHDKLWTRGRVPSGEQFSTLPSRAAE